MSEAEVLLKRILIVDDEAVILRLLKRLFKTLPYELVVVDSVAKGLEMVAQQNFHLLLTDLRLPDGNGVDVAKKYIEKCPSGKIIIMTGSLTQENHITQSENISIHGFLGKPFELDHLKTVVMKALEDVV